MKRLFLIAIAAFDFGQFDARATDLNWRTDGTSGTWTGTNWSSTPTAIGGTAWTSGNNAVFTANSAVAFASTGIGNVTLDTGTTVSVTAAGTLAPGTHDFNIGTGSTLTWANQSFSITSASNFTKDGAGTWNIGAEGNNYTGAFTLNAGTIVVSGAKSFGDASSILTVNGGTIQTTGVASNVGSLVIGGSFSITGVGATDAWGATSGSGTITTSKTETFNGNISPGTTGAGTIAFAGGGIFSLSSTTSFSFDLGTSSDLIDLSGSTLALGSGLIDFSDFGFSPGAEFTATTYTLLGGASSVTGSLAASGLSGSLGSGFNGAISRSGNDIILTVTAVPEPHECGIMIGGFLGVLVLIRHRRSANMLS